MDKKYFICGFYSGINIPLECFRPTDLCFPDIRSCIEWIEVHKKYFASSVHFGICSFDNNFVLV